MKVETAVDPVCGMTIERREAAARVARRGRTYFFCSEACLASFEDDPESFAAIPAERF